MAEVLSPITRQVTKERCEPGTQSVEIDLREVEDCLIYDRRGNSFPFKNLYQDRKSVIIFVRVREGKKLWFIVAAEEILALGNISFNS